MRQLTKTQVQKNRILKAVRSNIRLKHALAADEEINRVLPELERQLDAAIQQGNQVELDVIQAALGEGS